MYLGWIDYGVLVLLLRKSTNLKLSLIKLIVIVVFSCGIGIYQGCVGSKQTSTQEFLVADGRMKVISII
jgi:uncharacterized membrane protein